MESEINGRDLLDPVVLAAQIDSTAAYWGSDHRGDLTAAYWYGLSQVLLDPLVTSLVAVGRRPATADPRGLTLYRAGYFFTEAVSVATGDDRQGLTLMIQALCQVSDSAPAVFNAIAGDSLGSRLIFNNPGGSLAALSTAAELAVERTGLPLPRLALGSRDVVLERSSCCRLFRLPRGSLCTACPRRSAQERAVTLGLPSRTLGQL